MKRQTTPTTHTPKRVARTLVTILKKLDAAQGLLVGEEGSVSKELDKADTLVFEVRERLKSLIAQLHPQAAKDRDAAHREKVRRLFAQMAGPGDAGE